MTPAAFRISNQLRKYERLSSEVVITKLFKSKQHLFIFPFKVIYILGDDAITKHNQMLISVPKKYFKSAVDRNLVKRRVREAYRLSKTLLDDGPNAGKYIFAFIYVSSKILDYVSIKDKINEVLNKLLHDNNLDNSKEGLN